MTQAALATTTGNDVCL